MDIALVFNWLDVQVLYAALYLVYRYRKEGQIILIDFQSVFLVFTLLYIAIPASFYFKYELNLIGAPPSIIESYYIYSNYFLFVLLVYGGLKSVSPLKNKSAQDIYILNIRTSQLNIIYVLILCIYLGLFFATYPGVDLMWRDRRLSSDYYTGFNDKYKVTLFFFFACSLITYLVAKERRLRYLFMLTPFICFDILTTSRTLLLQSLFVSIFNMVMIARVVPMPKISLLVILLISIEFLRTIYSSGLDSMSNVSLIPGELLFTTLSTFFIMDSALHVDISSFLINTLGHVLTVGLFDTLIGDNVKNFVEILNHENTLSFGLGGALLSEVYAFKSNTILLVYPWIVCLSLDGIRKVNQKLGFAGVIAQLFVLVSMYTMFRGGFIFRLSSVYHYFLFAFFWYILLSLFYQARIKIHRVLQF